MHITREVRGSMWEVHDFLPGLTFHKHILNHCMNWYQVSIRTCSLPQKSGKHVQHPIYLHNLGLYNSMQQQTLTEDFSCSSSPAENRPVQISKFHVRQRSICHIWQKYDTISSTRHQEAKAPQSTNGFSKKGSEKSKHQMQHG